MTLSQTTREWYLSLPRRSVHSFDQFFEQFMSHFLANKTLQQSLIYLMTICQKVNESLRDYVKIFSGFNKVTTDECEIQAFIDMTTHQHPRYIVIGNNQPSSIYTKWCTSSQKDMRLERLVLIPLHQHLARATICEDSLLRVSKANSNQGLLQGEVAVDINITTSQAK